MRNGTFTFTDEDLKRAEQVHDELNDIVELFNMRGRGMWIEAMAISWIEVRDQHDFNTWVKSIKSKKNDILKMPKKNSKQWKAIFAYAHLDIDSKMLKAK